MFEPMTLLTLGKIFAIASKINSYKLQIQYSYVSVWFSQILNILGNNSCQPLQDLKFYFNKIEWRASLKDAKLYKTSFLIIEF